VKLTKNQFKRIIRRTILEATGRNSFQHSSSTMDGDTLKSYAEEVVSDAMNAISHGKQTGKVPSWVILDTNGAVDILVGSWFQENYGPVSSGGYDISRQDITDEIADYIENNRAQFGIPDRVWFSGDSE
tara:strand:+ start:1246 stop:1632 length:387 start_codon:yes stop_codon:yes gene_type:complete